MSSSAVFDAIAPEYAADPRADIFLTLAAQRLSPAPFGNLFQQAVCYLAAHMMFRAPVLISDGSSSAGPVTSRKAGDLSIGFGSINAVSASLGDADLTTSPYGLQFLSIRNSRAAAAPGVVQVLSGTVPSPWAFS